MSVPTRARGPLWLRAVHRLERAIGEPVESALRSDAYFDLVADATRFKTRAGRSLEGASRRVLHLLNLPAGSDIRRVLVKRVDARPRLRRHAFAQQPSCKNDFGLRRRRPRAR